MRQALFPLVLLTALTAACRPGIPEEEAKAAVQAAFHQANPAGRTGIEVLGKAVWLKAPYFQDACLEQKDLAFNDDPARRPRGAKDIKRISPTYTNQRFITASTEKGWCIYLGDDPSLSFDEARWITDRWQMVVSYHMKNPTPWFECLDSAITSRLVEVTVSDGAPVLEADMALSSGECPHPLPGGEERQAGHRPTAAAPKAPTRARVVQLMKAFDDALYDGEYEQALAMVSCYNLFEDKKYGTCSVAELISAGPLPRGMPRSSDGPPWLENVILSVDDIGAISKDRSDPSMYHVAMKSKRGGGKRSLAVQWVAGGWKLVGVVGRQAEALTTMRFVYDLDRKEKRDIFERRMQGEPIDEFGDPLDPYAEPEE